MDHNDHSVYLTFDDGPIPESTPFILQTLKEFGIHATFFMVGDIDEAIEKMIPTLKKNKGEVFGSFKKLTMEDAEEIYRSAV